MLKIFLLGSVLIVFAILFISACTTPIKKHELGLYIDDSGKSRAELIKMFSDNFRDKCITKVLYDCNTQIAQVLENGFNWRKLHSAGFWEFTNKPVFAHDEWQGGYLISADNKDLSLHFDDRDKVLIFYGLLMSIYNTYNTDGTN